MPLMNVRVHRFDPETQSEGHYQDYKFDVPDGYTVLDCLNHIKWYIDDTLAYRMSCRSAICGSCTMRVNGHAKLVCKTQAIDVLQEDGTIRIDPMGNMPLIKDLVVDMKPFWDKMYAVKPFLLPDETQPAPRTERLQNPDDFHKYEDQTTCIMCGACVSDCTSLEHDEQFLGPAALAKAYRFCADTRDGKQKTRLEDLVEHGGIWDCVRCNECVQVCPKTVAPMEAIIKLRQLAIERGLDDTVGARHVTAFTDLVGRSGVLDERMLPLRSIGFNPIKILDMMPTGINAVLKGKMSPGPPHTVKDVEDVRRIHDELDLSDRPSGS